MKKKHQSVRSFIKKMLLKMPVLGTHLKLQVIAPHNDSLFSYIFFLLKRDKSIYWPKTKTNRVINPKNIILGINSSIGGEGCYIQGNGKLIIGNYVRVATNVGILSGNHNVLNHLEEIKKTTIIGDYSWIGMNSIILPGVELGQRTVVAAGSVVTKSFPDGYCVLAGNPAKKVKDIDKAKFNPVENEFRFYGYIPMDKFEKFKKKHLL